MMQNQMLVYSKLTLYHSASCNCFNCTCCSYPGLLIKRSNSTAVTATACCIVLMHAVSQVQVAAAAAAAAATAAVTHTDTRLVQSAV
eukprot:3432-Heterococcus_DN1.PRE.2